MRKNNKFNKFVSILLCLIMITILLSACSSKEEPKTTEETAASTQKSDTATPYSMSIVSGSNGGAFYVIGAGMAQLINDNSKDITANSEASGGSFENVRLVGSTDATIGMVGADVLDMAYNGTYEFQGNPQENLRFILGGMTNVFQMATAEDSEIKSLQDLKGKNISIGPQGYPRGITDILEITTGFVKDKDYAGQYLGHAQAADAMKDGKVDAMGVAAGIPISAISEFATTNNTYIISLKDEEQKKLTDAKEYYVAATIPANTYKGQTEDIKTVKIPVAFVTSDDVPEDVIYEYTKMIWENTDYLKSIHNVGNEFKLENALNGQTIPLHPGAEKYYKEVGLIK